MKKNTLYFILLCFIGAACFAQENPPANENTVQITPSAPASPTAPAAGYHRLAAEHATRRATGRPDGSRDGTKHAAGTNGSGGTFRTAYSRGTKYTKCPKCAAAKTRRA